MRRPKNFCDCGTALVDKKCPQCDSKTFRQPSWRLMRTNVRARDKIEDSRIGIYPWYSTGVDRPLRTKQKSAYNAAEENKWP